MRPLMSAATSTLVTGCTWPLAVTEATRSRFCTVSTRTSVAFSPRRARAATTPTTAATATMPRPHFMRLLIAFVLGYRRGRPTADSSAAKAL